MKIFVSANEGYGLQLPRGRAVGNPSVIERQIVSIVNLGTGLSARCCY